MDKRLLLRLSPEDWQLLLRVSGYLNVPRSTVLRWALRYYCAHGDWPATGETGRRSILGYVTRLDTGPRYEEVD